MCFYNRCVQVRENEAEREKKSNLHMNSAALPMVDASQPFQHVRFAFFMFSHQQNSHKKLFCNLISLNMEECEYHVFWLEPTLILPFGFICNVFQMTHVHRSVPVVVKLYTLLDKV